MKKNKSGYWDGKCWQQERTIRDSLKKDGGHLSQVTEKSVWLTGKGIQDKGNRKYNGPEAEACPPHFAREEILDQKILKICPISQKLSYKAGF